MWATFRLRHLRTMLNTVPTSPTSPAPPRTAALLTFVLVSFAANSLVTRHVVASTCWTPACSPWSGSSPERWRCSL